MIAYVEISELDFIISILFIGKLKINRGESYCLGLIWSGGLPIYPAQEGDSLSSS